MVTMTKSPLEILREDFARKYPPKPVQAPQPIIPVAANDAPTDAEIAAKRAAYAAVSPETKAWIKQMLDAGLITGLRDVTFHASAEEAQAAWDAQPGYVKLGPTYPKKIS